MEVMRESVFVSALRSFCRAFFSLCGFFLALALVMFVIGLLASPYDAQENTTLKILPDLQGKRALVSTRAPVVLQINIHGVIGDPQKLDSTIVENILIDSRSGLLEGDRVKAILLHIDSPGGTVTDSDNIYRMIKKYKERYKTPVYAYVDGLCASGAMYIACAADQVYAAPSSVIGSVGVIAGPFFNVVEALTKFGVQSKTITEGLDKDMMSPFRTWKQGESDSIQSVIAYCYERFVTIVTDARPHLSKEKLVHVYGARIFDAPKALEYGYIDVAGADAESSLQALLLAAKIDPEKPYQVVELTPRHSILTDLVQGKSPLFSGKVNHQISLYDSKRFESHEPCAYLYEP